MTPLSFETKRAHWAMTWFGIRDFRAAAVTLKKPDLARMTPARFDILYLMFLETRGFWKRPAIEQCELVRRLGLHRSTVSKTVARMRELGWVEVIEQHYGRSRLIGLTDRGRRAIDSAMRRVFGERRLDRHLREFAREFVAVEPGHTLRRAIVSFLSGVVMSGREFVLTFGIWSDRPYHYFPFEET